MYLYSVCMYVCILCLYVCMFQSVCMYVCIICLYVYVYNLFVCMYVCITYGAMMVCWRSRSCVYTIVHVYVSYHACVDAPCSPCLHPVTCYMYQTNSTKNLTRAKKKDRGTHCFNLVGGWVHVHPHGHMCTVSMQPVIHRPCASIHKGINTIPTHKNVPTHSSTPRRN